MMIVMAADGRGLWLKMSEEKLVDSHVRGYFVEADPSVAFHLRLGVDLQLLVRVH